MADGWGGARKNAGRKPGLAKQIEAKAIEEAGEDARYALGLIVSWMRDDKMPPDFRKECADTVMDRVWGKAVQRGDYRVNGMLDLSFEAGGHDGAIADIAGTEAGPEEDHPA